MNGARAVARTLLDAGVEVCFANPGTSELHFVAALDDEPAMRAVPCLFEGVATGAADGYGRMTGRPAATLLHLGPGLGNGLANLHNARRATTPLVNLVGDHATFHKQYDAPLESDIDALARTVSGWVRRCTDASTAATDTAEAVAAAISAPGQVATVILPADVSWSGGARPAPPVPPRPPATVPDTTVGAVAEALRSGEPTAILLGGVATREPSLRAVGRIAAATGARLLCETFPARLERGAGLPAVERLGYLAEGAMAQLDGVRHLVLAGARAPVSFFAHPGLPSLLVPDGCQVHVLATTADDIPGALGQLADMVAPHDRPVLPAAARPVPPTGALTAETAAAAIGALLPEGAIVVDEANTSGLWLPGATAGGPRHDWLTLTGGAIGQGLPLAAGAAIACPNRPVLCLEADGSAMYTISALWTHAREGLDITTVVFANRSYAILNMEFQRLGAPAGGPARRDLLDLSRPGLDFTAIARGMGVPASRATTAEDLTTQLAKALAEPGPHLIEAVVPALF
ncbi:acetolactate synthase large subunit [Actinacidiphila oryziradicis]|uniref:Acetolactate synthase large subunit n=1 Tax=Actinacidiphila oryziradicis TaxID=2571141 RepID=A0A4V5N005_9ACTN|nr:acetolactate synthase large subunit [Actinacidiphila oryziradicis]TKA09449.1 acetolactate synthase large subunit [Actinacidiphila oryziradicis]